MASLLSFGKRLVDQINPLDNGRTFKNPKGNLNPGPAPSAIHQLTHNGFTNTVGNLAVKPFALNPAQIVSEIPRAITAEATHNLPALQASQQREWQNLKNSIPGSVAQQGINTGNALRYVPGTINDELHNRPSLNAQRGLTAFNKTLPAQMVGPAQDIIDHLIPGARQASAKAGYNTKASGAQKYFADPLMGTLGLTGLAKAAVGLAGKAPVRSIKETSPRVQVPQRPETPNEPAYMRQRPLSQTKKNVSQAERKYQADQSNLRSTGVPAFQRQAQAGAEALLRQKITQSAPPEPAGLLGPGSSVVHGPGFTMTPEANPAIIQIGKQISAIDKQLESVRQGKSTKSPDEVRSLVQQREQLAHQAQNPETIPQPNKALTKEVTTGIRRSPLDSKPSDLKLLNIKIKNVKDPARKAELVAERNALNPPKAASVASAMETASPYTRAPKAPNAFNRAWQTVQGVISQHGTGGKEIAQRLDEQRNQSEVGQQKFLDSIPTVHKLNKDEFNTFVDHLDALSRGERVNTPPKIQQAIDEWNKAIPGIRDRAVKAGLDVGDLGPNYFPRQYKDLFNNDNKMGQIAEQMVRDGKAKDMGDAMGKLQFMKNEYQKPFGNLEKTRQADLPGYEKTHEALGNYVARSFDRITKAEQFGAKNETLHQLLGRAQQEGYNATPGSTLDKYVKIALGDTDKGTAAHRISSGVRKFNALRSLSTAGISNATQLPVNTGTIAGVARSLAGAAKTLAPTKGGKGARAYAKSTGVLLDHSIQTLAEQSQGVSGPILRNLASPFFKTVEKFNRAATAVVGKDYGNHLASKGDVTQLREKFGVTGDIGKKLTPDQEVQVSRKLVELAQFKVDPKDLPGWVDSPTGKLVAQFRTFGYKQSDFMYNQVLREAVKGNFLPLGRFIAVGAPAGVASLAAKGAIKGVPSVKGSDNNVNKTVKGISQVGGFGVPGSEGLNLYNSAQYGNLTGGLASTVLGPTGSLVAQTADNLSKGIKGNWTPLKKQGVASVPTVGPATANRIFPKAAVANPANATTPNATPADKNAQAKIDKAALKPGTQSLTKLANGKYAYTLEGDTSVHDAKNLKEAQDAIASETFSNSGDSYKIIGDKVYRKAADGTVSHESKTKFDYQIGTQTLESQKRGGDLAGWTKTANSQLDSIEKQLKDPNIDPLDAISLQNDAEALLANIDKYSGYGGFTKPKSGRSGSSSGSTSGFKTASTAGKISPPKGVSVKKLAAPSFKVSGLKKQSVGKLSASYKGKKIS